MFTNVKVSRLILVLSAIAIVGPGCDVVNVPPGAGGNIDPGRRGDTLFTVVKTNIDVRHDAALRAGDDLVAFGTGPTTGVSYIIPSTNPDAGIAVPSSDDYDSGAFAVGGQRVFLVGSNTRALAFQVSVFDAMTGAITHTFPATDIRVGAIPASEEDAGNIRADGDFCVVICDQNTVTDGRIVKVINAGTNPPTLISFGINPTSSHFQVDQVDIDAATRRVVVVANSTFYAYDLDAPNAPPIQIAAPNGVGNVQIELAGDYVLALDNQAFGEAFLVDIAGQAIVPLANSTATLDVAIANNVFAFFADAVADDRGGGGQRAAVGTIPGPDFAKAAVGQFIDGSTANNGLVGYGGSMSVTPGGEYLFLSDGYLQFSSGNSVFTVLPDPDGSDAYGTPALDVDCSASTVAFKTSSGRMATTTTKVGYIVLP